MNVPCTFYSIFFHFMRRFILLDGVDLTKKNSLCNELTSLRACVEYDLIFDVQLSYTTELLTIDDRFDG